MIKFVDLSLLKDSVMAEGAAAKTNRSKRTLMDSPPFFLHLLKFPDSFSTSPPPSLCSDQAVASALPTVLSPPPFPSLSISFLRSNPMLLFFVHRDVLGLEGTYCPDKSMGMFLSRFEQGKTGFKATICHRKCVLISIMIMALCNLMCLYDFGFLAIYLCSM